MHVSQAQPGVHTLNTKQRIFIFILLFLGLLLSFVVVRFFDPSAALTNPVSSSGVRHMASDAVVC